MIFHQKNGGTCFKNSKFGFYKKLKAQRGDILLNFAYGFTGILYDWLQSLSEYRQLQFLQGASIKGALIHLYVEFCK